MRIPCAGWSFMMVNSAWLRRPGLLMICSLMPILPTFMQDRRDVDLFELEGERPRSPDGNGRIWPRWSNANACGVLCLHRRDKRLDGPEIAFRSPSLEARRSPWSHDLG